MALSPGTRIGPYEVSSLLGAGGMGEVYRAKDAKLNRDVALKVLPYSVTHDAGRVSRLRREAQVLASLNHPNIGGIYGLEDADGAIALVLELVEGPTLADRMAEGAVPVDEALAIGKQIADALAAAHEQGIVHRDLKPANIKLRPDGTVKVLDFGLAKAVEPTSSEAAQLTTITANDDSVAGIIRGTPAYMSPEQAAGSSVDRRTDIWAFGLILREMLIGERTFTGASATEVIAAVMRDELDWTQLPADTPATVRRLLRHCLIRDRKRRLDSASAIRVELDDTREDAGAAAPGHRAGWIGVAGAIGGAIVTAAVAWLMTAPPAASPTPSSRFTIAPPAELFLRPSLQAVARDFAVAPDGSFLVYRAGSRGELAIRWFDRLDITTIAGVTAASMPFVSPDSKWIGFVQDDLTLKKVAASGGAPVTLAELPVWPRGASWVDAATIVIGTNSEATGLLRVPAGGGEPVVLTTPDRTRGEEGHVLPSALPGGREVLFTIGAAEPAKSQIAVYDLQAGTYRTVLSGGRDAQYVASGHVVYLSGLALSAIRFDLSQRATVGEPVRVIDGVAAAPTSALNVAVTAAGTMVFIPVQEVPAAAQTLLWVDRQGRETSLGVPARPYESARLSPDGTSVAVSIRDEENDIWVWSLLRQTLTRVTFDPDVDRAPVWTPDSRGLVFTSARTGAYTLYSRDLAGAPSDVRLTDSANTHVPNSITPDGAFVIGHEVRPRTASGIARYRLGATVSPADDLVSTPFEDFNGEVSPDGRWLAYQSDESGVNEIYVRAYPVTAARWQVSSGGAAAPAWTRDGRELIYLNADRHLTSVSVALQGDALRFGPPVVLVKAAYTTPAPWRAFDVSRDGQRFLVMKPSGATRDAAPASFVIIQGWFQELAALMPSR